MELCDGGDLGRDHDGVSQPNNTRANFCAHPETGYHQWFSYLVLKLITYMAQ